MNLVQYITALQLLTFFVNAALGIFIFVGNPGRLVNKAFALFAVGVAGWNLSIFLTIIEAGALTLLWGRLAFSFAALMATGLLWFIHEFPEPSKHSSAWRWISWILSIVFFAIPASPYMITRVAIVNGYITGDLVPFWYWTWDFFYLITLLYTLVRSWKMMAQSKGLMRNQMLTVSLGITAFIVPYLATNIVLPLVANDFRWNNLGPIFSVFLIIFITRAIIRYRFLEIRWVIKRGSDFLFQWGVAVAAILGLSLLLQGQFSETSIEIMSALVLALFYIPVARYFSTATSRLASRGSYYFDDAVSEVSSLAHASLDLSKLQRDFADRLQTYFGFSSVVVVTFTSSNATQAPKMLIRGFSRDIVKALPDVLRFSQQLQSEVIEMSELRWILENGTDDAHAELHREVLRFLQGWNIHSMIPLTIGGDVVGIALLGQKEHQNVFSEQDIALLRIMRGAVAPAMANAVRFTEMKQLYTRLSELDRAKSDFINVVSHQFRTPLTSILWNAEMSLEQKGITKKEREMLSDIFQSAEFLNTTLSSIVDMLELDNNSIHFEKKPVDLNKIVESAMRICEASCKDTRIELISAQGAALIMGDEIRMRTVVSILLSNACKYTKQMGQVRLEVHKNSAKHLIEIVIADEGIGISKKDLPHIFEKFFRGENALQTAPDGTGVGLYLVKRFIEKQHGDIAVESKLGKGTTFTLSFPEVIV